MAAAVAVAVSVTVIVRSGSNGGPNSETAKQALTVPNTIGAIPHQASGPNVNSASSDITAPTKGANLYSGQRRLTSDTIDKRMKQNLDDLFSRPASSSNPPPKPPDRVNVQ